jgi:hypothetical protein
MRISKNFKNTSSLCKVHCMNDKESAVSSDLVTQVRGYTCTSGCRGD